MGICLPYSFALLIIYYKNHSLEIKRLKLDINNPIFPKLKTLKDENGKIKFSIPPENLLFFESTDNYVTIYYLQDGITHRELIRNSLKSMEGQLSDIPVKRCHRSYIVNLQNLEFVQKKSNKLQLKIKNHQPFIPVSKKFSAQFLEMLSQ